MNLEYIIQELALQDYLRVQERKRVADLEKRVDELEGLALKKDNN